MRTVLRLVAGLALLSVGCAREHLSPAFGRANREAYAMQQVSAAEARPPPSMTLDTQEASVISESYVRSLSGKGSTSEPGPVLFVAPQRPGQGQPQQLAPSVPKQ
jgi:hypothetical protein